LTFERNSYGEDFSRRCDYQQCNYICDTSGEIRTEVDTTTFDIYYSTYLDILPALVKVFEKQSVVTYESLYDQVKPNSDMQLLKSLAAIIENRIEITTYYGMSCYLKEENNIYYLVPGMFEKGGVLANLRCISEPMLTERKSMKELFKAREFTYTMQLISSIEEDTKTQDDARDFLVKLPKDVQQLFVEKAIEQELFHRKTTMTTWVISIYNKYITKTDGMNAIVKIHGSRCLPIGSNQWIECNIPVEIPASEYGVIGIENDGAFCLQDTTRLNQNDRRKQTSGSVCVEAGWKKSELVKMLLKFNIEPPQIKSTKTAVKDAQPWIDTPNYQRALSWASMSKQMLCDTIQSFLNSKNLVIQGNCGTSKKKKLVKAT
jgi:hypothetical protein